MKHLPKLFIETTVFNFYLEGKHGKKQKDTMWLFDEIAKVRFEAYTSEAVIREIKAAPEEKYRADALHISIATVNALDFVISFNQGHIVKTKTMIGTGFANLRYGFRQIGLCTPTEVSEYDF